MSRYFNSDSFPKLYPRIVEEILEHGVVYKPRGLETTELRSVAIELTRTDNRFISDTIRDMNPVFPIVELMWYLSGSDRPDMVTHYASKMSQYVNPFTGAFDGAYGHRWRKWGGSFDQIASVLSTLHTDPDSRRAVLTTFNPLIDCSMLSNDIPCNVMFQFFVRDSQLHLTVYCRSQDAWYGLPNDLCEWQMLQQVFAGWLEISPGMLTHFIGSLHVYKTEYEKARMLIKHSGHTEVCNVYDAGYHPLDMLVNTKAFQHIAQTFYKSEEDSRLGKAVDINSIDRMTSPFWKNAMLAIIVYNARKHNNLVALDKALLSMDSTSDIYALLTNWIARRTSKDTGEEVLHR